MPAKTPTARCSVQNHWGAVGLIRVEVLGAAGRSRKHLGSCVNGGAGSAHLAELFAEAVAQYRTQCLWNIDPQATPQGLRVIASRLRKHGDMAAWRLAGRIEQGLADAAR